MSTNDWPEEYTTQMSSAARRDLIQWLQRGSGSFRVGRACFESVVGGGVLVRVRKYRGPGGGVREPKGRPPTRPEAAARRDREAAAAARPA